MGARSKGFFITTSLAIDTDAYTALDVVGGLLTFATAMTSGYGFLEHIVLIDQGKKNAALKLWIFDSLPSTIADDAAFDPSAANANKIIAYEAITSYVTLANSSIAVVNLSPVIRVPQLFYGYLTCDAALNPDASTDFSLSLSGTST